MIFNPDPWTCCITAYLQGCLFGPLKKASDWDEPWHWTYGIASGLSVEELSLRKTRKLEKLRLRHPADQWDHFTMSMDGSSHDAH